MTKLLLLSIVLAAAPAVAADFAAPEGLHEAVAAGRAMGAAKKAAAKSAAKRFDALTGRLIKEGAVAKNPHGLLHAFQKTEALENGQRDVTVGVLEVAGPKGEGHIGRPDSPILDLVERHTYDSVEAQVMTVQVGPDGKAKLDSRIYIVDMGGRVRGGSVQSNDEGALQSAGGDGVTIKFDDAKTRSRAMTAGEAQAGWDALLPELAKLGRVVEI